MITKSQILCIFYFLLAVFLADQLVGSVSRKLYFTQKTGQSACLNYSLQKCKTDILIFGNSRAQHHYDTRVLSDCLKMSCYNAGIDGGHSILLPYSQIKVMTKRHLPKIIILEFRPSSVEYKEGAYDRLSILLPYYSKFPELRPIIQLRSPSEKIKLLSAIYPFNSDIINLLWFNTNSARKKDIAGYIPFVGQVMKINKLAKQSQITAQPQIATYSSVDTNMIIALQNIIRICKEKNISLFIFNSPSFHEFNEKSLPSPEARLALEIINRNKVNYVDFSFDSRFIGQFQWFKDMSHLNEKGASIYSQIIGELIKKKYSEILAFKRQR